MIILMQGVPGSGKTTWAKEHVFNNPEPWVRISRDDLRMSMHGTQYNPVYEALIRDVRDRTIEECLKRAALNIVIDETSVKPTLFEWLLERTPDVHIKQMDTPLEECIRRDAARDRVVGEELIRHAWNEMWVPPPEYIYAA